MVDTEKEVNINKQVDAFIGENGSFWSNLLSSREGKSKLPQLKEGETYVITNDQSKTNRVSQFFGKIKEKLFGGPDNKMEVWEFNFLQDVMEGTKNGEFKEKLANNISSCLLYKTDEYDNLIPHIRPYLIEKIGLECFTNKINKLSPKTIKAMTANQLRSISNEDIRNLTKEQITVLIESVPRSQAGGKYRRARRRQRGGGNILDLTPGQINELSRNRDYLELAKENPNLFEEIGSLIKTPPETSSEKLTVEFSPVNQQLTDIRQQLSNIDSMDQFALEDNLDMDKAKIGNMSGKCILHCMGKDKNFFPDACKNGAECPVGDPLDFSKIEPFDEALGFIDNRDKYARLYQSTISLIEFVSTDEFSTAAQQTQTNVLNNLDALIEYDINFLTQFMEKYQLVDSKLIRSGYNLLLLRNSLGLRRVNVNTGRNMSELQSTYDKLVNAIKGNIDIYKRIVDKVPRPATKELAENPEIRLLIDEIQKKLTTLESSKQVLESNLRSITANGDQLSDIIESDTIRKLSDKIKNPT